MGSWFVLRTYSRQEKILARELIQGGVGCFLPLVSCRKTYAGFDCQVEVPLFPGHVFMRGNLDEAYSVERTGRLAQIVLVPDQRRFDEEMSCIFAAIVAGVALSPHPYLRAAVSAEVREGPLRGIRGVVDRSAGRDRLVLQVEALGQAVSIQTSDLPVGILK
jgi:hypothetical protein